MRQLSLLLLASLLSSAVLAQKLELSDAELKIKADSILQEAHLLYKYERAAWLSCDLAVENHEIDSKFGGYLVYEDQGEIKTIILETGTPICIAEYSYLNDFNKPNRVKIVDRALSEKELSVIYVRGKIISQLSDEKYEVTIPEGFNPNVILIPFGEKYKFYIIMGTSETGIIPFGNDYLFIADSEGNIESHKKFHSGIIAGNTEFEGQKVISMVHSHLITTPFITATDICTFMLYAPLFDIDSFSIYSTALEKYMTYSLSRDEITMGDVE